MSTEVIDRALPHVQTDYQDVTGRSFEHFYCPLMMRDEDVELCMGHVIPQSLDGCSRHCVVQRKDVDNFYGKVAEGDFGVLMKVRDAGLKGILSNPALERKVKPRLFADGEQVRHYPYRGNMDPQHSRIILQTEGNDKPLELVAAIHPEEMGAEERKWGFEFEYDGRIAALVTLIKSAYLTMFRLNGYRWALSSAGMEVGYSLLGRFFREHGDKDTKDIQPLLKEFFMPYKTLVRPVASFVNDIPVRGTLEDHKVGICFGSSGHPFGLVVYVRVGERCHGVLMPAYTTADAAATYFDFLRNNNETLRFSPAKFDLERKRWEVSPTPVEAHWPKKDASFDFE